MGICGGPRITCTPPARFSKDVGAVVEAETPGARNTRLEFTIGMRASIRKRWLRVVVFSDLESKAWSGSGQRNPCFITHTEKLAEFQSSM